MRIRYLSLTNFRNYARLELALPERPLLLYGANAQGKTSLLEAVYLLATGSSPLTSRDHQIVKWEAEAEGLPYTRVWGEVERREMFIMTERQCKDIFEYRERQQQHPNDPNWPPMPDLIVIIDEFGEFLKKNSRYIKTLDNIGAVGRGLGMHLVMCSQFVDRTLLGDMFNHLAFRYSLAVNDPKHSREMIGTEDAVGPSMSGGSLRGKILRKFNSDVKPVEIVSFRHEDAYVRRSLTQRSRSGGALVTDTPDELVVPLTLIDDRGYTPVIDGEIVDTKEVTTTA